MGDKTLEEIWKEMMKETFKTFIEKNVGWDDTKLLRPKCYKSGDDEDWCIHCAYQETC